MARANPYGVNYAAQSEAVGTSSERALTEQALAAQKKQKEGNAPDIMTPETGGGVNITPESEDKTDMTSNARSMFFKKKGY